MRNEREYWERRLKISQKQEEEFRKREEIRKREEQIRKGEEKEDPKKKQAEMIDRVNQTTAIIGVIGGVLLYFFLWALFDDFALAAFFWLLFFAVFGWFKG